jgi:hypothetical protein
MFTPRDFQLRISGAGQIKKIPALPFSQSGDAPVSEDLIRPTQLPEAGAHQLEPWTACFEQSLNDP